MADVSAVGSAGGTTTNVQSSQENQNTAKLFSMLLSSMLNESSGSIGDFSNTDGSSDSDSSLSGDSASGLSGSSGMMDTLLFMMLLSKQGNGSGISSDLLTELMGMGSSSSALSSLGSSLSSSGSTDTSTSSLLSALSGDASGSTDSTGSLSGGLNSPQSTLANYLLQYQNASKLSSIPAASWLESNPGITSHVGDRSASEYRSVINQFNVEDNERYRVNKLGQNDTYCNIFAWDVSRAMGAEIPHYINATTGEPAQSGGANVEELDANATNDWLNKYGKQYGWVQVNAQEAQTYANQGMPTVTSWKNSNGHGHMQVVSPSTDGKYDSSRGVAIAQAGEHLYNYNYSTAVYSENSLKNVQYFAHI